VPQRRVPGGGPDTPRWQDPEFDAAALDVARRVRAALSALHVAGDTRWTAWFSALVPSLEDGGTREVAAAARRVRAAFGTADGVLDAWRDEDALRLRDATDDLLRILRSRAARGDRGAEL
jgi:hypothetical protein